MLCLLVISLFCGHVLSSPFGPVYPITASIFKDRFSMEEWNQTLDQFKSQGGDTVVLRAPPLMVRTKSSLDRDPDFMSCSSDSKTSSSCYDVATLDLIAQGLKVSAVVTYNYEEDYGPTILNCPEYDKILPSTSNTKYHRIVIPVSKLSTDCKFSGGTTVVVVLTVYSGVDPHLLLLHSASIRNISVMLGIPAKPEATNIKDVDLMPAYENWMQRVLQDQRTRYSKNNLYNTVVGYLCRDGIMLSEVDSNLVKQYKTISDIVHVSKKKFIAMANIDLNRFTSNRTVSDHVQGFALISESFTSGVDVISVHEGRGYGKAGFYWPTQINQPINESDPTLFKILQRIRPSIQGNATFNEVFSGSVQELFLALHNYRNLHSNTPDLWLLVEAEEYLQDELCLPVDTKASGNNQIMDRVSKSRVDNSLTAAGAAVQKVMAFAFDPEFTCTTKSHSVPLVQEIIKDSGRPIISNCSFHSSFNRSVVLIGYNFDGLTQAFTVHWPDRDGKRHIDDVHGYYFELDYGTQHGLIPSLEYTQLYDPYDVITLADHGYVKVKAGGSYHGCEFTFDYRSI